jgi:hypothetical protein
MTQGKKGAKGSPIRFMAHRGLDVEASSLAGPLARARGAQADAHDVHRLAHLIGIWTLRRCTTCTSSTVPCDIHSETAMLKDIGIEPAPPKPEKPDAGAEHQALIDLYAVEYEKARGCKPAFSPADLRRFRVLRETHKFDRVHEMIRNAFRDPYWRGKVTIFAISKDPSAFLGLAAPASGGTLQREGVGA